MDKPLVSIVIRAHNEIETIKVTLTKLQSTKYPNKEIIVIDNESTDGTYEYSLKHADKVINISNEDFTHSKSTNLGIENSNGKYVYFTNGHALPIYDSIFDDGVELLEEHSKAAGVFGIDIPYSDKANIIEKTAGLFGKMKYRKTVTNYTFTKNPTIPLLNTITTLIRKDLLEEYKYDESLKNGGEDYLFALLMIDAGYQVYYHKSLDVYHSHGGSFVDGVRRYLTYMKISKEAKERYKEIKNLS